MPTRPAPHRTATHPTWCEHEHCTVDLHPKTNAVEMVSHEYPGAFLTWRSTTLPDEGRTIYTVTVDGWTEVDTPEDLDELIAEAQRARAWLAATKHETTQAD